MTILDDVRFALRLLRKSPGATVVSIVSLALGIGATTAVSSLVEALLLNPLPAVHDPGDLVAVAGFRVKQPEQLRPLSWADYRDYAGNERVVFGLAAATECDFNLTSNGPAERLAGLAVSTNYFDILGLRPTLGRFFSRRDETAQVAVLGYGLWTRQFGANPKVIGSSITLNEKPMTVVGIAPRGFLGTDLVTQNEIWLPLGAYSNVAAGILIPFSGQHDRKQEWLRVFGRLAPGTSVMQAQSAFDVMAKSLAAAYPKEDAGRGVRVLPLSELAVGKGNRPRLFGFAARLMVGMALVLAVAAINVAGLLLARALTRRREIAIRITLGATRKRLIRQLFIEGLILGLLSAIAGIGLARAGLPVLERIELPIRPVALELALSGRVLAFGLLISLASCLVFALLPALQAARTDLATGLRGEVPRGHRMRFGLREILTGFQIALSFLILVAAGLMLRTITKLRSIDPGFNPGQVLVTTIDVARAGYKGPSVVPFYDELLERLRHLPGVKEASMASALPVMGGDLEVDLSVTPDGALLAPSGAAPSPVSAVRYVLVGSRYFQTVGIRILRGHDFGPQDRSGHGVVIINERAAHLLWPTTDALGRHLRLTQTEVPFEVVGIATDATYASLKEKPVPVLYLMHAQSEKSFIGTLMAPEMTLLVRTSGEPRQALTTLRETVRAMDSRRPVFRTSTLEELLASTIGVERQAAALYSGLALVAVALAMLGLYGVLVRAVVEQSREIGVRVACGATPGGVRRLVLRRSAVLGLCGVGAGLALAVPASQLVAAQLYGVHVHDPVTWISSALVLTGLPLVVSAVPASRAAQIDPVKALRDN